MRMQKHSKGSVSSLAALLLVLWILLSVASYLLLVQSRQQRFDFYPRWVGSRVVLAGESPYTQEVTWYIQEGMFGRRLGPGEDEQRFAYPATIAWILLPFWQLPFPWAVSLWCGLQFILLLALPAIIVALLGWRLRPLRMMILLICSLLVYRYPIVAYILGQFAPFILACVIGAWWGVVSARPVITILSLVGATIRPELALLPVLVLLVAAWREGRRGVIGLWIGLIGFLWLVTRVRIGPWVMEFGTGIRAYADYSFPDWPPAMVGVGWLAWLVTIGVLVWGGWMLVQIRSLPVVHRLPWELSVAILVGLIVLPQTNNYTLILGLLPAWVALWASKGRWLDWVPVLAVLASPWIFYAVQNVFPMKLEQLLVPLMLSVLLFFRWCGWWRDMNRIVCEVKSDDVKA